ncbi:MAG: hypothetical protein COS89_04440 [Deltaproteobacteria bacterium CG07_land_8_20_14_0_80_38_7]|nr:MAG: hypothetical protein COS89_04440 [Deltaproteobacteria bacterium CG07_land_8_20_14_0_80_38_7]
MFSIDLNYPTFALGFGLRALFRIRNSIASIIVGAEYWGNVTHQHIPNATDTNAPQNQVLISAGTSLGPLN